MSLISIKVCVGLIFALDNDILRRCVVSRSEVVIQFMDQVIILLKNLFNDAKYLVRLINFISIFKAFLWILLLLVFYFLIANVSKIA